MNNFFKRTITGILFVVVIVAAVIFNSYSLACLFIVIVALASYEFAQLLSKKYADISIGLTSIVSTAFIVVTALIVNNFFQSLWLFLLAIALIPLTFVFELYRNKKNPIENVTLSLIPLLYIVLPFGLLYTTAFHGGRYHYEIVLGFFLMLWMSDTGAYLVGSKFGKHKLFERISPKKTWEGSIGGAVLSIVTAIVLSRFYPIISIWNWCGAALIIVVFGNFGDLAESLFKRSLDVKDSGNILPGHGGLLDRFDGLLLAAPIYFIYLMYIYSL